MIVVVSSATVADAGKPGPPEQVSQTVNTSARAVWRIDRPRITQPETRYPQITFKPGDRVTISAGGCARRGGYPPPNGPAVPYLHGDNIYMGTIYIPGIVPGAVKGKIEQYVGAHDIPWTMTSSDWALRLGYEDNAFGDNNYNDIDDIDAGPCKGLGYAYVQIEIDHGAAAKDATGTPLASKPMDLIWSAVDDNGLPLDPEWKFEKDNGGSHPDPSAICDLRTPGSPQCTSQNITDDSTPNVAVNAGCNMPTATTSNAGASYDQNAGHKNWWAATFTGSVSLTSGYANYLGASLLVGWDADLDFAMWPNSGTSLTYANVKSKSGAFSVEFDGDEVMFDRSKSSNWWSQLYQVEDNDHAKAMFNPGGTFNGGTYTPPATKPLKDSVVLGLVGLDCRHDCYTELHPVYALAAHTEASQTADRWAVFARNWGNEGSCGAQDHQLELTTITLRIPHPGATKVELLPASLVAANTPNGTGWNLSPTIVNAGTPNAFAQLSFALPQPEARAVIEGELVLKWTTGVSTAGHTELHADALVRRLTQPFEGDEEAGRPTRGDPKLAATIKALPAAKQQAFRANLPAIPRTATVLKPAASIVPKRPAFKHPSETHKLASNQVRIDELNQRGRELCTTLGNKVAGHPEACHPVTIKVPPVHVPPKDPEPIPKKPPPHLPPGKQPPSP